MEGWTKGDWADGILKGVQGNLERYRDEPLPIENPPRHPSELTVSQIKHNSVKTVLFVYSRSVGELVSGVS